MWTLRSILLVLVFSLTISAYVTNQDGILRLESGKLYKYEFNISSELHSPMLFSNQSVSDHVTGLAVVQVGQSGILEVQIQNVRTLSDDLIMGQEICQDFQDKTSNFETCIPTRDHPWTKNMERAILSHFQMTIKSFEVPSYTTERDISGECLTEYTPQRLSPTFVKIVRKKYTAGCNKRFGYRSSIQLIATEPPKREPKIPFVDGSLQCTQIVEDGVGIVNSTCTELITIAQSSKSTERTDLQVQVSLHYLGRDDVTPVTEFYSPSVLTFEFKDYLHSFPNKLNVNRTDFIKTIQEVYQKSDPELMYKAIKQSQSLNAIDHQTIFDEIKSSEYADLRTVYTQIMIKTGTTTAFGFLYKNMENLDLKLSDILTALRTIETPTAELFTILHNMLDTHKLELIALPVSEAVHRVCLNEGNCETNEELQKIVDQIFAKIGADCSYKEAEQLTQVIISLRALGNIGRLVKLARMRDLLNNCLANNELDVFVHVTSIDAIRLTECDNQLDMILWDYLSKPMVDVELRIAAYRSYMRCPMENKLTSVLQLLQNEPSQQFGSYVYSHLTNVANLAGPIGEPWAKYIGPYEKLINQFRKRFALNRRSYAKHYGGFYRIRNAGLNIDASVIFGPESPIPRYISVNLTLDIFGGQSNLLEFGIRSTEQIRIWDSLLKRTISATGGKLDELEMAVRKERQLLKMSTAFVRVNGQDRLYINDFIQQIKDLLTRSSVKQRQTAESRFLIRNRVFVDSSLFVPTIGGFPIEITCLGLKTSRDDSKNSLSFTTSESQINWTSSSALLVGSQLKIRTFEQQAVINQWHRFQWEANMHGLVRFRNTPDSSAGQIYLKNWDEDQMVLKYKREHYALINDETVSMSVSTPHLTLLSQTPDYFDTLLGLKATSNVMLADNTSELFPTMITLSANQFRGLDAQFDIEKAPSWFGSIKRIFLLFTRPGESDAVEKQRSHLEFLFEVGNINLSAQFVQIRFVPPWQHELEILAEVNENGALHSRGNFSSTPWELYGLYQVVDEQQKFTAKVTYPSGMATVVFRGNVRSSFKLQMYSTDESWPIPFEMTQRSISSRHTYYPSFERFHHETQMRLRNNQTLNLQLEWNTGRRNGRLEQGVIRLKHISDQGHSEMRSAITWTEGDQTSRLDNTVQGYERRLTIETQFTRPDRDPLIFSLGADQFVSHNFWMIHTDLPAIVSFHAWTHSPDMKFVQLNYTAACTIRYRLDQGGSVDAFSNLIIPAEKIDALARMELQWRSIRQYSISWIRDVTSSLTLRIFPPDHDRYFRANFSHAIAQNVITTASVEFDSRTTYLLESTLYRGQPLHSLRLQWPPDRVILINTTYQLQLGPKTAIAFNHVLAQDEENILGSLHTEILYDMETGRLIVRHNSINHMTGGDPQLIVGFEWGNELHGKVTRNPLQIEFKAERLLQLQIPLLEIDCRFEALLGNRFNSDGAEIQLRLLYTKPTTKSKYGMDMQCVLDTRSNIVLQAKLDFYLSGQSTRSSGCELKYNSSDSTRLIALECNKENIGSIMFHEKFRQKESLQLEGSHMLAILPKYPTERFPGWYSNYNYAIARSPLGATMEVRGEFTPNSGSGPGTPIRLYVQFSHDESYRSGSLEMVLNSQHIGYWTGYEMVTSMSRYELNGLDIPGQDRTFTLRSIFGVRLLEGRGTRAYEAGLQATLSPLADQLLFQIRAGKPGMTRDNSLQFQYSLAPLNPSVSTEILLFGVEELAGKYEIKYNERGQLDQALFELAVKRLDIHATMKIIQEDEKSQLIAISNDQTVMNRSIILVTSNMSKTDDDDLVWLTATAPPLADHDLGLVNFSHHVWKGTQQVGTKMNVYLSVEREAGFNRFANVTISSSIQTNSLNEVHLIASYPWPIEADIEFGQTGRARNVYRHEIRYLSGPEHLGWLSQADCSFTLDFETVCGLSHLTSDRTVNLSLFVQPESSIYRTEIAWDRTRDGLIQTSITNGANTRSIRVDTPLRQLFIESRHAEATPSNSSLDMFKNYTIETRDMADAAKPWDAYATLLVYKHEDQSEHHKNWTYGSRLHSNMLVKETAESTITLARDSQHWHLNAAISTGDEVNHQFDLLLTPDDDHNDTVRSSLTLKLLDEQSTMTGRHVLKQSYTSSELNVSQPIGWITPGRWNVTIDSWNNFQITNFNDTFLISRAWRNNTHGSVEQNMIISNEQVNLTHQTSMRYSPFYVNSILTSNKGHAWFTSHRAGNREFLLEAEHSSRLKGAQPTVRVKDLVARFLLDPQNAIRVNLNWRPGLINEILLHGTELSDMERVKRLMRIPVPLASTGQKIMELLTDENFTSAINRQQWEAWSTRIVEDCQHVPRSIDQWWKEDRFYMNTFGLPVVEQLGRFNVTDLAHNITIFRRVLMEELKKVAENVSAEDMIPTEQLEALKLAIERDRFPLFRPTFEAMVRMANKTIWTTEQFANFLFYKLAACTNAVYTLQQSLRNWATHQYSWLVNLSQSPFVTRLGEFFADLQSDVPALKPMSCFANMIMESVSAFMRQTIQYCKRLIANSILGKEYGELFKLMATGQFENASRLFFKPHLARFQVDLDEGLVHLSAHVPALFEKLTSMVTGSQSYPRQLFSWIYPNRGMRSVMYAYDQYQRNFEAMRKLVHLIPPYKVTAWLMMDSSNNGYVITFNGLFIPVTKPHLGPYLLLTNTEDGRKLRIVHHFADSASNNGWFSRITVGWITIRIDQHGAVQVEDASQIPKSILLPYKQDVDESTQLRISRNDYRITLRVLPKKLSEDLLLLMIDIQLGLVQVQLGGAWHGQCRGLLGSNDFDQLHELFKPSMMELSERNEIGKLWSYNLSFTSNQTANETSTELPTDQWNLSNISADSVEVCTLKWQKFQPCFAYVPPDPWIEACAFAINLSEMNHTKDRDLKTQWIEESCTVSRAYVQTCNRHDVPVRIPHQCVSCVAGRNSDNGEQSSIRARPITHGRRITFLIEMGMCLIKRMNEIAELLTLMTKSKQNSRMEFSALLFTTVSGETETTRMTAHNGAIWMSGDQFLQTLLLFVDQSHPVERLNTTDFVEWPRVTESLSKAVRQPAAVNGWLDSILLYVCSGCTPEGSQYKTLVRVMKRKAIDFHYIPEAAFVTAGDLKRSVFLLTSDDYYDEIRPNGSTRRIINSGAVTAPRDHCSLIAQGVRGYIWSYQNVATTKQRLRTVVTAIAGHLSRETSIQRQCVCRDDLYGAGILDCSVTVNQPLKNTKRWNSLSRANLYT